MAKAAATGTPRVRFESLAFQVDVEGLTKRSRAAAQRALKAAFATGAGGWELRPLNRDTGEFEAVPRRPRRLSPGRAWDLAYKLRDVPNVVYAEPLFEVDDRQQQPAPAGPAARSAGNENNDPGTAGNFEWSLTNLKVQDAWALFPAGQTPGSGIVVGHPDTGYTQHAEILPRLRPDLGFDFVDDDADPTDPLAGGFLANPGHGTGTSSVIISPVGQQLPMPPKPFVSGVAPGASLIPIRTTKSVVLFSMSGLTRALRFAMTRKVHVVSISLGGPFPSDAIHNAVKDAEQAGVIVCCAAGNQVRFVVFPAAFDEVIAVAASRIDDDTWSGSCRGPAVDITAPGSSVWRARTEKNGAALTFDVQRGSGTSFAVAHTAGLAALWLSFHGRDALVAKYGAARLAGVFKQLLQSSCRTPAGWDTGDFGPGIAHAKDLLEEALPSVAPASGMRGVRQRAVSRGTLLDVIAHQLAPAPRSGVVRVLADLLDVDEERLPEVLDDIGRELAMNVGIDPAFRASLQDAAIAQSPAPGARGARRQAQAARTTVRRRVGRLPASRRLAKRLKRAA